MRSVDIVKRRLFKLCLFLLLGAIVNIAVSWSIAILEQREIGNVRNQAYRQLVTFGQNTNTGATVIMSSSDLLYGLLLDDPWPSGWPCSSLQCANYDIDPAWLDVHSSTTVSGLSFRADGYG